MKNFNDQLNAISKKIKETEIALKENGYIISVRQGDIEWDASFGRIIYNPEDTDTSDSVGVGLLNAPINVRIEQIKNLDSLVSIAEKAMDELFERK